MLIRMCNGYAENVVLLSLGGGLANVVDLLVPGIGQQCGLMVGFLSTLMSVSCRLQPC